MKKTLLSLLVFVNTLALAQNFTLKKAIEVFPADTVEKNYVNLNKDSTVNYNRYYYGGAVFYPNSSGFWYKFKATSKHHQIRVQLAKRNAFIDNLILELYAGSEDSLIARSALDKYGDTHCLIESNDFIIGKVYYYRLIKARNLVKVRLENNTNVDSLSTHQVLSIKDSTPVLNICTNSTAWYNPQKYPNGRKYNRQCSNTGKKDAITKEFYFKICGNIQFGSVRVEVAGDNENKELLRKLIIKGEILDSINDVSSKCNGVYYFEPNNFELYSQNKILRIEISDTSKVANQSIYSFSLLTYVAPGGLENNKSFEVLISPNPSSGEININFQTDANKQVIITDLIGKEVKNINTSEQILTIDLPKGFYLIKSIINNLVQVNKVEIY